MLINSQLVLEKEPGDFGEGGVRFRGRKGRTRGSGIERLRRRRKGMRWWRRREMAMTPRTTEATLTEYLSTPRHLELSSRLQILFAPCSFREASYSGGGNITFKGSLEDNTDFTARIFQGDLLLGDLPLHFTYSVKSQNNSRLGLFLNFVSTQHGKKSVLLVSWNSHQFSSKFSTVIKTHQLEKPGTPPGWIIEESSIRMKGYRLTEIQAVCYRSKPEFDERIPKSKSGQDNSFAPNSTEYYAVLGHISMKSCSHNSYFPPSDSWLVQGQCIQWTKGTEDSKYLSLKITWKLKDGIDSAFSTYNIYIEKVAQGKPKGGQSYLGVARVEAFYVYELAVASDTSSIKFIIQVCGGDGSSQKLDDSPVFLLDTAA